MIPKTPNKFDYVLQMYAQADSFRQVFKNINRQENYAYSISEAHAIIKVPIEKCGMTYKPVPKFPNAENMYKEHKTDSEHKILTTDLLSLFASSSNTWYAKKLKCAKCKGDGVVTCNHCDNEADCKSCKGTGESSKDVPFAALHVHGKKLKFFDRLYHPRFINQMIIAAVITGATEITVLNGPLNKFTIFNMDSGVSIYQATLMPSSEDDDAEEED